MENQNDQGGVGIYNAAALKVAQIRKIIDDIHFCHLHYKEINLQTNKVYLADWLSLLGSIKLEIYSKLSSTDKKKADFMLNSLTDFLNTKPIYYPQLNERGKQTGKILTDYHNEEKFLKWINEFEKFVFIGLDRVGMDNPSKEAEGGYN
jgi:hypothetical protein